MKNWFNKNLFSVLLVIGLGSVGVPAYMATPVAEVITETVQQHVEALD